MLTATRVIAESAKLHLDLVVLTDTFVTNYTVIFDPYATISAALATL